MPDVHNELDGLQGGNSTERYHLTAAQWTGLTGVAAGQVAYASATGVLATDPNSALAWDASNRRLGIGLASPGAALHIYRPDPVLLVQDTDTGVATANARLRLGESGAGGVLDNYWDVLAGPGSINFSFQVVRSSTILFEILHTTQQVLVNAGSASSPGLARVGYADDGLYWPGGGLLAVALGDAERWRWSGNDVGMVAGGKLYLDGVTCNNNTYLRERTADVFCVTAGGYDQFEVWNNRAYLRPNSQDPASDGQFNMQTGDNAFKYQLGSVVHRNGLCIYSGGPEEDTTVSSSDRTLDSFPIPAAYWKIGKRITIIAPLLLKRTGPNRQITGKLYIGSTPVMEKTFTTGAGEQAWEAAHCQMEMSFVVGALSSSGFTIYPIRTLTSFHSNQHGSFDNPQTPTTQIWPMDPYEDPDGHPGLQIDTTVGQTIAVKYACNNNLSGAHAVLQGLTIYST